MPDFIYQRHLCTAQSPKSGAAKQFAKPSNLQLFSRTDDAYPLRDFIFEGTLVMS